MLQFDNERTHRRTLKSTSQLEDLDLGRASLFLAETVYMLTHAAAPLAFSDRRVMFSKRMLQRRLHKAQLLKF
jgi:hypothetical protein